MRLLLLRHGKAAPLSGSDDLERPLAPRGRKVVPGMGAYLAREKLIPDLALVSPARRARETWDLIRDRLGDVAARQEPRIYEASADQLLTVIRAVEPDVDTLMIVGHNPGLADLVRLMIGFADRDASERLRQKFPTAGLALLDLPADAWSGVKPGTGRLDRFVTAKSLGLGEDD